jgi:dTDP-4-amino-4,6-dideoxygalactose transaminase
MKKLINIDLVPNFENDDFEIIKRLLHRSYDDLLEDQTKTEKTLKSYFPDSEILFFSSARGALYFLLSQIKSKSEEHIITQAFSCLVVPLAIKSAGYKPIYTDIDDSFNIDIQDLKNKITNQTKAIIIQNTFGLPAKIDDILNIAKEKDILIIENLTHSLGAKYKNTYLGNFGQVALLSFNRNKVISSIIGGALVIREKKLAEKIKLAYQNLPELSAKEIAKILFTGKVLYKAKLNYCLITKIYLKVLRQIKLISEMISKEEKEGNKNINYSFKFPKILFPLLENQLKKLERFNNHRKKIANLYNQTNFKINEQSEPIFLRFPFLVKNSNLRKRIFYLCQKENIYLGDWYQCVLSPCSNLETFDYKLNSCPHAELISKKIINLPTYINITPEDVQKIIKIIKKAGGVEETTPGTNLSDRPQKKGQHGEEEEGISQQLI